jgi:hypothetical protein
MPTSPPDNRVEALAPDAAGWSRITEHDLGSTEEDRTMTAHDRT